MADTTESGALDLCPEDAGTNGWLGLYSRQRTCGLSKLSGPTQNSPLSEDRETHISHSQGETLSFEGISALVVKYLSPVEQLSPFKIGQIQKLIADIAASAGNSELGGQIAPYFAVAQVVFLLLFVAYFVIGVVALAVDAEAMDAACATDSWIWLYSLLVVVIPTSIGFVIGLVQSGLQMIKLDDTYMKYADGFLVLPGPILFVTLGVLGIVLWGGMTDECDVFYAENHGLLLGVFHLQVIIMSIASIFGTIALIGTIASIWASVSAGYTKIDEPSSTKTV